MHFDLLVTGGTVVSSSETRRLDVGVSGGKVEAIGELGAATADVTYDASRKLVFPGFIDSHVHSREPGLTHKEDFAHSTRAAAAGGITTIVEMPNTVPPLLNQGAFERSTDLLARSAFIDFAMWGLVLGNENLADLAGMANAGVVAFKLFWGYSLDRSTQSLVYNPGPGLDVVPPPSEGEILTAFRQIAATGRPVAIHAENASVIAELARAERDRGEADYGALLRSRPAFSEAMTVDAGIRIAEAAGVHLHVLHVSTAEAADRVAMALDEGKRVTAETCPHYLFLTDSDYASLGNSMKIFPLVRGKRHQERLWRAVVRGEIYTLGSDHAPHTAKEKGQDIWSAPAGASSIQATLPLMLTAVNGGRLLATRLVQLFAEAPAELMGIDDRKGKVLPGYDADIVVVDMDDSYELRHEQMASKSPVGPYDGVAVTGRPVATFLRGRLVAADGAPVEDRPSGRLLTRKA